MSELFGGCRCGQVQYKLVGPIVQVVACHCGLCRSMTGAPLSSYAVVKEEHVAFTDSRAALASYAVTEHTNRHFCVTCGTPLFNSNPHAYRGLTMLYLGTVQGHERLTPGINIYCESKLSWVHLPESSKNFSRNPTKGA
jgi:hypothetical protein